jgi:chorismate-pyruvate lyase
LKTQIALEDVFRQQSVTQALAAIYGRIHLEVLSQRFVDSAPPACQLIFGEYREPLLERRIRLLTRISGEDLAPLVYATSWIRLEAISPAGRDELRAGRRMLGEILADENDLTIRELGLERAASPLAARALDLNEQHLLLLRLRCWSNSLDECVVLLQECAGEPLPQS